MLDDFIYGRSRQQLSSMTLMATLPARTARPDESLPRRGGMPGGSALGGCEEFRELRLSRRSSSAIRSSCLMTRSLGRSTCSLSSAFCAESSSSTTHTTSRPCSKIASASTHSMP
jgi:hypothetical protein